MNELFQAVDLAALPIGLIAISLAVFTLVSEDAACLLAGTLASQGRITLPLAILACLFGILLGDVALYALGRAGGDRVLSSQLIRRFVPTDSVGHAREWLERRGAATVFISRFVTGLRLPTYVAAGILKTDLRWFLLYFVLAAAAWTPFAVGAGYLASGIFLEGALLGLIAVFITFRVAGSLSTRDGRRQICARFKRVFAWEFWPLPVFYTPVFIYSAALALKHRSPTVFTCANPSIEGGGFAGESKDAIYKLVRESAASQSYLLKHRLIPAELPLREKLEAVRNFLIAGQLSYPVVLKPDIGERGKGVAIVHSDDDAARHLSLATGDIIVQEYFDGVEASIFYFRHPDHSKGTIFSITEKQFPFVSGDGRSTLRSLIMKDRRAVMIAKVYFRENAGKIDLVPAAGTRIPIVNIGSHSRGAIFRDGEWLRTERLYNTIDELCRGIPGFYFGRLDIRAKSYSDIQDGGPFKIIELNGVSSESTNIYDEKFRLSDAYRILFRQWRIAFEIGAANRSRGSRPMRVLDLVRLALRPTSTASKNCRGEDAPATYDHV